CLHPTTFILSSVLFIYRPRNHSLLHSLPTRRSSDLETSSTLSIFSSSNSCCKLTILLVIGIHTVSQLVKIKSATHHFPSKSLLRSEEHTSELQSRFDLVCRLLLEKKNIRNIQTHTYR